MGANCSQLAEMLPSSHSREDARTGVNGQVRVGSPVPAILRLRRCVVLSIWCCGSVEGRSVLLSSGNLCKVRRVSISLFSSLELMCQEGVRNGICVCGR